MAATWEDMGARDNAPMHATAFCSPFSPAVRQEKRISAHPRAAPFDYECGAICRAAAVTAASLQTPQLRGELS